MLYLQVLTNTCIALKRKTKKSPAVSPDFLDRQRASLRRTHRQVIYLNEKELAAIDEYCRQFKISAKSALYRQAIMERILAGLDQNHPTLF